MKKFLAVLALALSAQGISHAGIFEEDGVLAHYVSPAAVTISTAVIIIDLSDTTNYPHKQATYAQILSATIITDQVAAGTSTVKLGVVTSVNTSSGTVSWFMTQDNTLNVSATNKVLTKHFKRLYTDRKSGGVTRNFITNDKTTASTADRTLFQSDVVIPTTSGTLTAPAVGDIVAEIIAGATNGAKVTVDVEYVAP